MNKKGLQEINLVTMGLIILGLMGVMVVLAITVSGVKEVTDGVIPKLHNLPAYNDVDVGGVMEKVTTPAEIMMNNAGWILGVIYVLGLVGILGIAMAYKVTGEKYLIVLFILIAILCVLGSIIISNTYQNLYESSTGIGENLKEFTLLSWLLLYSPIVITVIVFFAGAIIFSGLEEVAV